MTHDPAADAPSGRAGEPGPSLIIRPETPADHAAVRQIHLLAFGGPAEAGLVDSLRAAPRSLSLVAVEAGIVVGHVLFSAARVQGRPLRVMALGPVAVLPHRQRAGIGSALLRRGLEVCLQAGEEAVVVVGHPAYYPRFGFRPGNTFGLRCQFAVPDEVFMAAELRPGALAGGGDLRYAAAFAAL